MTQPADCPTGSEDQGFSVLGIRIPDDQRAKIRDAAKIEDRTESSFARYYLNRAAEDVIAANTAKADASATEAQP